MGPALKLSTLDAPMERILLSSGREVNVRSIDGATYRAWMQWQKAQIDPELRATLDAAQLWEMAARCIPDATQGEVDALSVVEAGLVIRIASGQAQGLIEQLERIETGKAPAPVDGAALDRAATIPSSSPVPA